MWCGVDYVTLATVERLCSKRLKRGVNVCGSAMTRATRADARRTSPAHPDYQRIHRRAGTHAFWI
jgi:hypothetical protein